MAVDEHTRRRINQEYWNDVAHAGFYAGLWRFVFLLAVVAVGSAAEFLGFN